MWSEKKSCFSKEKKTWRNFQTAAEVKKLTKWVANTRIAKFYEYKSFQLNKNFFFFSLPNFSKQRLASFRFVYNYVCRQWLLLLQCKRYDIARKIHFIFSILISWLVLFVCLLCFSSREVFAYERVKIVFKIMKFIPAFGKFLFSVFEFMFFTVIA